MHDPRRGRRLLHEAEFTKTNECNPIWSGDFSLVLVVGEGLSVQAMTSGCLGNIVVAFGFEPELSHLKFYL